MFLLVGALVLIAVIVWLFLPGGHEETRPAEHPKRIAEARPARRSASVARDDEPSAPHPRIKVGKTEFEMKIVPHKEGRTYRHSVYTNTSVSANAKVTSSAVEQVLFNIFSRELGDMPMPLPVALPEPERVRLAEILISKNPATDEDSEEIRASKEILDQAKKAMREHIRNGGEPEDFIVAYHEELMAAFETRMEAQGMVQKMVADGEDDELVEQFVDKVNETFNKEGIREIPLPQHLQDKREDE